MTELKDRYLGAVLRAIPEDQRSDVDTELRAAIDDAIDGRVEQGESPSEAEVTVLNELGDPDILAAGYTGRPLWVLGPRYYMAWLRLIKMLSVSIPPIAGVVSTMVRLALGASPIQAFLGGMWIASIALVNVVFWTTTAFVIAERVEYSGQGEMIPMGKWKVEYLPRIPDRQIGAVEIVGAVVVQLLVIGVLVAILAVPPIPVLNPELWDLAIPLSLVLMVVSLGFSLVKLRIGRWTTGLAAVNGLLNIAFVALWYWILIEVTVLSEEFVDQLNADDWLVPTAVITVATIAAVCAWDAIDGYRKACRARSDRPF